MVSHLKKTKSRRYPAETITYSDYADDLSLLKIALAKAEFLLYILEPAARGIGLYLNANKKELICLQEGAMSS